MPEIGSPIREKLSSCPSADTCFLDPKKTPDINDLVKRAVQESLEFNKIQKIKNKDRLTSE